VIMRAAAYVFSDRETDAKGGFRRPRGRQPGWGLDSWFVRNEGQQVTLSRQWRKHELVSVSHGDGARGPEPPSVGCDCTDALGVDDGAS